MTQIATMKSLGIFDKDLKIDKRRIKKIRRTGDNIFDENSFVFNMLKPITWFS